mgnify:CR=1 FL=1
MSYTIDIYRGNLQPTKSFISYATYVSFFPQLVAGPIERATNLLPQILFPRKFKYIQFIQGLRLIAWGMFKKVVIADSLDEHTALAFDEGSVRFYRTWISALSFTLQLYFDFSGYMDMALGISKMFISPLELNPPPI